MSKIAPSWRYAPQRFWRWIVARRLTLLMSVTAVACAAGAYRLSADYLDTEIERYRRSTSEEDLVGVVVPSRRLVAGNVLSGADLMVRQIPAKYVDSQTVVESTYPSAIGQTLITSVDEGRALLWAHLDGIRPQTFSGHVPSGLRALTVQVDEVNAISGFLQPGDRVDLMLALSDRQGPVIRPLLDNLEVLATGQSTEPSGRPDAMAQGRFSTITVKVSPIDAQRITLAQSLGRLTAVLRNPDDSAPAITDILTADALFGISGEPESALAPDADTPVPAQITPRRQARRPRIEYIIGGS